MAFFAHQPQHLSESRSMAHVPAERCLGIIELLADGASAMPLGEIAERLELPKSGSPPAACDAGRPRLGGKDPGTGFYRLTMRLAVLGQRFYVAPASPISASRCSIGSRSNAASSRDSRWSTATRWCGSRTPRARRAACVYQPAETTVPCRCTRPRAARRGSRRSEPSRPSENVLQNGGFDDADKYGPNVIRSIEALLRDLRGDGAPWLRAGIQRGRARCHRSGGCHSFRSGGARGGHGQHRRPERAHDRRRVRELAPLVMQCASELSSLWPLRPRAAPSPTRRDVVRAA